MDESGRERAVGQAQRVGCGETGRPAVLEVRMQAMLGEILGERFAPPGRGRDDDHPTAEALQPVAQFLDRMGQAAIDGNRRQGGGRGAGSAG
jgi:hypothetical protein